MRPGGASNLAEGFPAPSACKHAQLRDRNEYGALSCFNSFFAHGTYRQPVPKTRLSGTITNPPAWSPLNEQPLSTSSFSLVNDGFVSESRCHGHLTLTLLAAITLHR